MSEKKDEPIKTVQEEQPPVSTNEPVTAVIEEESSVPIGEQLNPKAAENLAKRAAMYYHHNALDSLKSAAFEGISNVPTWYLAATQFNPALGTSAAAGASLTASLGVDGYLNFARLSRVLHTLEEYEGKRNDKESDKSGKERKKEALIWLEKEMHKEGLLYEEIPKIDLKDYPDKTFKAMRTAQDLFIKKGELKNRIGDVCNYLQEEPKEAALKTLKTAFSAPFKVTLGVLKIPLSMANILNPSYAFNISKGLTYSTPKMFSNFKLFSNSLRQNVKQVPHFEDMKNGHNPDEDRSIISDDFVAEVKKTNQALKNDIVLAKIETAKLGTETLFMGGHAMQLADTFNAESLANLEPTKENLMFLVSAASTALAWTPFNHMAKALTHYVEVGTSKRAIQGVQSKKTEELYDKLVARQERLNAEQGDVDPDEISPS